MALILLNNITTGDLLEIGKYTDRGILIKYTINNSKVYGWVNKVIVNNSKVYLEYNVFSVKNYEVYNSYNKELCNSVGEVNSEYGTFNISYNLFIEYLAN